MTALYRPLRIADGIHASAARTPERMAIRCGERDLTYQQLEDRIRRISRAAIDDLHLRVGDCVALLAPNCLEYCELMCGLTDAGVIVATLNPRGSVAEVAAACRDSGSRALIVHPALESVATAALALLTDSRPVERTIILGAAYESWLGQQLPLADTDLPIFGETHPFSLVYSSGTTGEPKGILLSHRSRVLTFHGMAMEYGCYGPDDRFLALAPLAHGAGFAFAMATLFFGGYVEIAAKFDPTWVLARLASGAFTGVFMVPTHFQAILSLPADVLERHRGSARQLRTIISNASALAQSLKQRVVGYFGPGLLHETYGSTEAGIVSNIRPADQLTTTQSVGHSFALNEVRLLDDAGRDVAPGQLGELYSRSPYLFNGYWNRPQATQECMLEGGWVSAGDIARRDPHGFLYIVDRKKDMVISGGINIYPREIELALEQHPAVLESAVVGVPDDHWGERLRAFVVVRPGVSADEQLANELARFCAATVAAYKVPRELGFIQEVPRNIGGKVLKRDLRVAAFPVFVVHKREPQIHERA